MCDLLLLLLLLLLFPASSAEPVDFQIYPDLTVDVSTCTVHGNKSINATPCARFRQRGANGSHYASCENCFKSDFMCNKGGRNKSRFFYCPRAINGTSYLRSHFWLPHVHAQFKHAPAHEALCSVAASKRVLQLVVSWHHLQPAFPLCLWQWDWWLLALWFR
jgi:hypothetical protein